MKTSWYLIRINLTINILEKNTESDIFKFESVCSENSKGEVTLEITIDNKLTFDSYIKGMPGCFAHELEATLLIKPKKGL